MDILLELIKVGLSIAFIGFVLLAIATLFIVIFEFATDIDDRITRRPPK